MSLPSVSLSFLYPSNIYAFAQRQTSKALDLVLPRNAITGSREIRLIPKSVEVIMGHIGLSTYYSILGGPYSPPQAIAFSDITKIDGTTSHITAKKLIRDIGKNLSRYIGRDLPYQFNVTTSSYPNSFCAPGGKIFITSGCVNDFINSSDHFIDLLPALEKDLTNNTKKPRDTLTAIANRADSLYSRDSLMNRLKKNNSRRKNRCCFSS